MKLMASCLHARPEMAIASCMLHHRGVVFSRADIEMLTRRRFSAHKSAEIIRFNHRSHSDIVLADIVALLARRRGGFTLSYEMVVEACHDDDHEGASQFHAPMT